MPELASDLIVALADRYRIVRELGSGGMATVWLADDLRYDRPIALKLLRADIGAVVGADRFLLEIRTTAKLQHPHILPLLDSGEAAGRFYYAMPFVEGETLRQRLQREKQLPINEALHLATEVAEALDYAHQQGVIHRDIKPENILLSRGHALVADFGIALAVSQAGGARLTETGLSLGTPAYMSPEQAMAESDLDGRTDQYSLGCVVYEMLAGEPPYVGPTAQAIISKRLREPVPHLSTVRDVPPAVEQAVTRALAKSKIDRFQSAGEFIRSASSAVPVTPKRMSRRMVGLLAASAVLVGAALLAVLAPSKTAGRALVHRQLTFSGTARNPVLSPDGSRVAFVLNSRSLVVQDLTRGELVTLIPESRFLYAPRWSKDGKALGFVMFRDSMELAATYLVSATGGPARKIVDDQALFDFGPDSLSIVSAPLNHKALEVLDLRSGEVRDSIAVPDSLGFGTRVRASPNGNWVIVEGDSTRLVSLRGQLPSVPRLPTGRNFVWAKGSDSLYFLSGTRGAQDLMRVSLDSRTGRTGPPELIVSLPQAAEFEVGPQGTLVYTTESSSSLVQAWSIGANGEIDSVRRLTESTRQVSGVAVSDDGQRVAFASLHGSDFELEVVPFQGGPAEIIASSPGNEASPSWAPDGSLVAFFRGQALMVVAPSKDADPRRLGKDVGFGPAAWSADGRTLAYLRSGRGPVVIVNSGTGAEQLVEVPDSLGGIIEVGLSPDGNQVLIPALVKAQDWWALWQGDVRSKTWRKLELPFGEWFVMRWESGDRLYLLNDRALATDHGNVRFEIWLKPGPGPARFLSMFPEDCSAYNNWRAVSRDGRRAACLFARIQSDLYVARPTDSH